MYALGQEMFLLLRGASRTEHFTFICVVAGYIASFRRFRQTHAHLQSETQYYLPVCNSWGVWAAWHAHMLTAIDAGENSFAEALRVRCKRSLYALCLHQPQDCPVQPCTTFSEVIMRERALQSAHGSLELKVCALEAEVKRWREEALVFKMRCAQPSVR
jgi:hypothetical protein